MSLNKKNIVFVMNEYNGHGGTQRVTSILTEKFKSDGHNVHILSINEFDDDFSYFEKDTNITVLHQNGYRPPARVSIGKSIKEKNLKKVKNEFKRRKVFKENIKKIDDFFDSFGEEPVFVIAIQVWGMQWLDTVYYRKNVFLIGQSHESYEAAKQTHRYKKILKYYRMADSFTLLSAKDAETFANEDFNNTNYILNPSPFYKKNIPSDLFSKKKIVSVGRLIEDKGFQDLIQAFANVHSEFPEWELELYGDGPHQKELSTLVKNLNAKSYITLKGPTENVVDALSNSSIFVLPSYAEGLPMVLIEAISCGLPCIGTDCSPGMFEMIKPYENGLIFIAKDIDRLSSHLRTLMSDENTYINFSKNSALLSEKFNINTISQNWYDLFDELESKKNEK